MPWQKEAQDLVAKHMEDFFFGDGAALPPGYVPQQAKWITHRDILNAGTPEWTTRMDFTIIGKKGQMAKGFRMEWTTK